MFPNWGNGGQRGYSLSEENTPRERRGASPSTPALAVWRLKSCAACGIGCLPSNISKRFDLLLSSRPLCLRFGSLQQFPPTLDFIGLAGAYQGGIAALAAFIGTIGRRKLGCTSARSAERQRMQEAKANRLAPPNGGERSNAATQGTPIPQAPYFFELQAANGIFSGWVKGRGISFSKRDTPPCFVPMPRGAVGSALRCKNPILHTFCRPTNNNPASFIWKETVSIWKSERNSGVRCRL